MKKQEPNKAKRETLNAALTLLGVLLNLVVAVIQLITVLLSSRD